MKVMKFGGSSVANAQNINNVLDIVLESLKNRESIVVVVSAFGGVTDELIKLATLAGQGEVEYKAIFKNICQRHDQIVAELVDVPKSKKILAKVYQKYQELEKITEQIFFSKNESLASRDLVMSFGEQLSAIIICEAINTRGIICQFVDARELIKTDDNFGNANVDIESSYALMGKYFKNIPKLHIMGGFIGSTKDGITTTLGRGGSDYTASLVGAALDAQAIEMWKDVDGLMTADPRKAKEAIVIPKISYQDAEKMAEAGAKVIYSKTIKPAQLRNIPIFIKNTFNPSVVGTKISNQKE